MYEVVHRPFVFVRAAPSLTAATLGKLPLGALVEVAEERADGWLRLLTPQPGGRWVLRDGATLGLGLLLRPAPAARTDAHAAQQGLGTTVVNLAGAHRAAGRTAEDAAATEQRGGGLHPTILALLQKTVPIPVGGPLQEDTAGPVMRWRVERPVMLVHALPERRASVVDAVTSGEYVWSCAQRAGAGGLSDEQLRTASAGGWIRLASPNGWANRKCVSGQVQLERVRPHAQCHPASPAHWDEDSREMEALDLWTQARRAVWETVGPSGRLQLRSHFDRWEAEAVQLAEASDAGWQAAAVERALISKSAFSGCLLAAIHRDVVLWAQQAAATTLLRPAECSPRASERLAWRQTRGLIGGRALTRDDLARLCKNRFLVVDGAIPPSLAAQCRAEAEELDQAGLLQPPAMHRALGDRRDRLCALDGRGLVSSGSKDPAATTERPALATVVELLKALPAELSELDGDASLRSGLGDLLVTRSAMLACYDGGLCAHAHSHDGPRSQMSTC